MWMACGHVTRLWRDWGDRQSSESQEQEGRPGTELDPIKEARWRRAWKLSISRKYVRRYVEQVKLEDEKRRT